VNTSYLLRGLFSLISWALIIAAVITGTVWCWNGWRGDEIAHAPGILIREGPVQIDYSPSALTTVGDWSLTRLATFHITGRVLGVRRYSDERSALAPSDVALGWGPMSDTDVLQKLKLSQGTRMFFREFDGDPPIPENDIIVHSTNLHVIPADVEVAAFVTRLRIGELIDLRGALVAATDGITNWRSSLSRGDVGPKSGELFYVTEAHSFNRHKNIAFEEVGRGGEEARYSLQSWYQVLELRRRTLNVYDQQAVRAYNEEARRYMTVAHPEKSARAPIRSPKAAATRPAASLMPGK